ncbi:Methylated-DNA--protein-cysteine methyltransferase [Raoultella terrigena]|uniref:Methylated-DNA--protein-cysteine methyltransferase n=1 Tax=Raoultella terrigena TaxID=577 RepID=A0A4U9CVJ8_RAOTE|nr:Methylated-DNA--protein-cysteine methyltransferase [Raoultella terrigena]
MGGAQRADEQLLELHYRHEGYQRVDSHDPGGLSSRLGDYFAGDLAVIETLPTATAGTPFQREVWKTLRTIPCGQVMHYGQLAEALGRPGAARAVGGGQTALIRSVSWCPATASSDVTAP